MLSFKWSKRFFSLFFLILALVIGMVASLAPFHLYQQLSIILRFFEFMVPVLAVGALLKYLFDFNK
jgi:hypothetical protein